MSEVQSGRRQQAQQDLGLDNKREQQQINRSIQKEEERQRKKMLRQIEIEGSTSYQMIQGISKWMDKYFIDPLLGLVPGVGDVLSSICVLPFIYVAAFKVRSLPLTLAVIFNVLCDAAIGLIPFWIGNIADIFNRAYLKNMRLIVGFVDDDKETIARVNKNAFWMGVLIVIFCLIIYWLVGLAIAAAEWIGSLFN